VKLFENFQNSHYTTRKHGLLFSLVSYFLSPNVSTHIFERSENNVQSIVRSFIVNLVVGNGHQ
jgi:hypothetical protein